MSTIALRMVVTGFLFLVTVVFGVWLSNSGKPLNTLIFTIHKLTALAAVIFTVIVIHNLLKNVEVKIIILTLILVAGLSVLALFISGVFLSLGKPVNNIVLTIHRIMTIMTVISTAVTIYLLAGRKQ